MRSAFICASTCVATSRPFAILRCRALASSHLGAVTVDRFHPLARTRSSHLQGFGARSLPVEQGRVGPRDELVERVIRQQGGQAHGDPDSNGVLELSIDRTEPALHAFRIDSAEPADDLVPAVPDNRVEGP